MARKRLLSDYLRFRVGAPPSDRADLPISEKSDEIVNRLDISNIHNGTQLNQFRQLAQDRQSMYDSYDEMKTDSIIAAALELYADDATAYDEQGRIIWVESDDDNIVKAGNRLLDLLEIPERSWKHIYQACLYGDYYLKLYTNEEIMDEDSDSPMSNPSAVRIVNDKTMSRDAVTTPRLYEYVEDVADPSTIFDLRKRGKTAGFVEVTKEIYTNTLVTNASVSFQLKDITVYPPDRFIHIMIGESMSRTPEEFTIEYDDYKVTYQTAKGKSILQDVYPVQRELQLLEDSLLLNRLTRSSLIRLLEIEVGDMPKKEANNFLRRIKNLIEQHIALDTTSGNYKSFQAPGPIDNVIYIPVRNGKGSISVNNLGGDVNVRDISDIDYFNNKRAGALKIPRAYLGDDMESSGLGNGTSLTRLSQRYARTIKRIQTSYIRAITNLLNLYFLDKKLDYINKFQVRMASPSTQEDLERNELISGNIDLVSSIMDLTESFEGDTQKKILVTLFNNIIRMPEIADIIEQDGTESEDIQIDGEPGGRPDFGGPSPGGEFDLSDEFSDAFGGGEPETNNEAPPPSSGAEETGGGAEGGFTAADYANFEDNA